MNEHGLMLGECTNNSLHLEYLAPGEGKGIFYASELGRVALERCRTAREAVQLMGSLIDEYGLWGTGETLLTRGYYSALQPEVLQAAHEAEARAYRLTADASGQSPAAFQQALAANAERTLADWRDWYGKILVKHDGDHHIDYAASEKIKGDPVEKY